MISAAQTLRASLCALMVFTGPLSAQDAANAEADTPATEAPAQAPALSEGTPIDAENNIGRTYTLETFDDWELRCIKAPEGQADPCSIYQLLKDESGNEVAEVTMFNLGEEKVDAAMTITTPLETLLTAQLSFFVDEANGRRYPFSFCTQVGCFVRAGLTTAEVDQFKKGAAAQIGVVPASQPDKTLRLTMSLSGFTAAYAKVTEMNVAAREAAKPAE